MNLMAVIYQIIMLMLLTLVGWYLGKKKTLTDEIIKGINSIVLKVAWPAMIIMTTQKENKPEMIGNFFTVLLFTAAILLVGLIVCYFAAQRLQKELPKALLSIMAVMPNAGFVGMPIIQAAYGDEGLIYLAAFLTGFNLILWTAGVFVFTGVRKNWWKHLLNPGLISAVIGTLLFVFGIMLPTPIRSAVNQLGSLTTPLAMLILGARLNEISIHDFAKKRLWVSTFIKVIVLPVVTLGVMRIARVDRTAMGVTVLSMGMPMASAAQIFAEKYNDDVELSVQGISVSTLLSMLTIPLILLLI